MLEVLETHAASLGLNEIRLRSSANARPFYERHGYLSGGEAAPAFGVFGNITPISKS